MDDSRVALNKAYGTVRERYNKLRLQHRQLLKDRTCQQCRQKLTVGSEDCSVKQTTPVTSRRLQSDASEIREICDQLKQIAEAGQVVDSCCVTESLIPRLQSVASQLVADASFDERQESLLCASAAGVSPSVDALSNRHLGVSVTDTCSKSLDSDLLQSQQVEIDAFVMETTEDFKTCEIFGDSDYLDMNLTAGR